jgi:SAM-dependent methyltransferase
VVETHGWYSNLEPTLDQLQAHLGDGDVLIDYSGGTGILADRLLQRDPDLAAGVLIVDASAKFLRLALEKLGGDPRVAYRRIRFVRDEKRLQMLDEVLPSGFAADAIVSTNAIHLYYGLEETLRSWTRVLKPGATAFVQSGNIANPAAPDGEWIIDETVAAIHDAALAIVAENAAYAAYRECAADSARMAKYVALRDKYFLPVRPLDHYLDRLRKAGFAIETVTNRTIEASVDEWYDFLAVYHEGVLGWVGGVEKIDGAAPDERTVADRLALMRAAMERLFGAPTFPACWTYITAKTAA